MFTDNERRAILFVIFVFLCGGIFRLGFDRFQVFEERFTLLEKDDFRPKVDINQASFEELLSVPYIGEYTAKRILDYRQNVGSFQSVEQVKDLPGIYQKSFERMKAYIKAGS